MTFFVEEYLEFVDMPNGHGPAMQMFSNIYKIPFFILREKCFLSVIYVDDSYLQSNDYKSCLSNVQMKIALKLEKKEKVLDFC